MHCIRIVQKDIFFGEEDEWSTHEDVDGTLSPRIVDEVVTDKEGELA